MIRSMTGYGSAKGEVTGLPFTLELRSVNNRYFDLSVRCPRPYLFCEAQLKACLQRSIARGKVDAFLALDPLRSQENLPRLNEVLARAYLEGIAALGERLQLSAEVTALDIARFPDVMATEREEVDQEAFLRELTPLVEAAASDFNAMREREGEALRRDLLLKLERIEALVSEIDARSGESLQAYRERLYRRLQEVLQDSSVADELVLAEAALYADRVATDEELVRLRSHCAQFRKLLDEGSPVGRKLDFLIQEFNREANTVGSKCQNSDIAYLVVDLKAEIEKIREQIQNIE